VESDGAADEAVLKKALKKIIEKISPFKKVYYSNSI
jgi:hypothetical protein